MAIMPDIYEDFTTTPEIAAMEAETAEQDDAIPKRTWRIDLGNKRIGGQIRGIDAVKQYVAKAILTARSRYLIYTDDYGCELYDLIGANVTRAYLDAEVPRMIREALIYHEDINDVTDVTYTLDVGNVYISVVLDTVYGDIEEEVVL